MFVDMPLENLESYSGKSVCPQDFEDFWARGLLEIEGVDPNVEMEEVHFPNAYARCYHLYFKGVQGAVIHAKMVKPYRADTQPVPALLIFHGYRGSSGAWATLLPYAAEGYCVVAMDCRGQAGLSEDNVVYKGNTVLGHIIRGFNQKDDGLMFRQIYLDTVVLSRLVADFEWVDSEKIVTLGASQGGALALACAALNPSIKLVMSTYPFLADFRRVWDMKLDSTPYSELYQYFRTNDPRHEHEDEFFQRLGYIDLINLAPKIKASVIMHLSLADDVCPPSTQFAVYNALVTLKEKHVYYEYGHEYLPGSEDVNYQALVAFK